MSKLLKNRAEAKRLGFDPLRVTDEVKVRQVRLDPTATTGAEALVLHQAQVRDGVKYGEACLKDAIRLFVAADNAYQAALERVDNRRPLKRERKQTDEPKKRGKRRFEKPEDDDRQEPTSDIEAARYRTACRLLKDLELDVSPEALKSVCRTVDHRNGARYSA